MIRRLALTVAAIATFSVAAHAEPVAYTFDKSHSSIGFAINHLGFSTVHGRFGAFDGTLMIDEADPAASSVKVSIATDSLETFWAPRNEHLKSKDFFNVAEFPAVTFESKSVEKTGDNTLKITGDLTLLGTTKPVTLDATVNKVAPNPMSGTKTVGVAATGTIKRSDYGMMTFLPAIGDEVTVAIDFEATPAE